MKTSLLALAALTFSAFLSHAQDSCSSKISGDFLDVNNVKTVIYNSPMLWFDCTSAVYEIPKGSGKHSMFAGALWIGGIDDANQLRLAAQTYRQSRPSDFWAGPLNSNASTSQSECNRFNKPFKINRYEVMEFQSRFGQSDYQIPAHFYDYPAEGNIAEGYAPYLAPFVDANNDGKYNPDDGDYPDMGLDANDCEGYLKGHQNLFTIFNDGGADSSLGVEVHRQAYALHTTDVLDNTTFYEYKIINRSSNTYNQLAVGVWIDPDIGNYNDDYIGCDVMRGMGYSYNGDDDDDGSNGYGSTPPAIGHDFFQGPLAKENDGIDNDFDGITDETGERILHSSFVYYNSDFSVTGNPVTNEHHFRFMNNKWKDGLPIVYGGDGRTSGGVTCQFMYPGDTDPLGYGTNGEPQSEWSEESSGSAPADRRFLHSLNNMQLLPGEVISWTSGMVWSQSSTAGAEASFQKLLVDDDNAQQLFDNCFNYECAGLPEDILVRNLGQGKYAFVYPGYPDNISWDFGNGNSSSDVFPTASFSNGTYTVCVSISTNCESKQVCKDLRMDTDGVWKSFVLTRVQGQGNGGQAIRLSTSSITEAMSAPEYKADALEYLPGHGPVNIYATDESKIPEGEIQIEIYDSLATKFWKLNSSSGTKYGASIYEAGITEIADWGIAVQGRDFDPTAMATELPTSLYEGAVFSSARIDQNSDWLQFVSDNKEISSENWIRVGASLLNWCDDNESREFDYQRASVLKQSWAPYYYTRTEYDGATGIYPAWELFQTLNKPEETPSVEIIFTPDKSEWTRVPVVELQPISSNAIGGANKMTLRKSPSVDKDGVADGSGEGYSWFPGFAVNSETGERLNILFGENSADTENNGHDMIWNPTSNKYDGSGNPSMGGAHYVYVMKSAYQGDNEQLNPYFNRFTTPSNTNLRNIYKEVGWVSIPILKSGASLLDGVTHISLNAAKPFEAYPTNANLGHDHPVYTFNKNDIVGLEQNPMSEWKIFPNPGNGLFKLQIEAQVNEPQLLEIYNLSGQLLLQQQIYNSSTTLDLSQQPMGVYLYKIGGDNPQLGKLMIHK